MFYERRPPRAAERAACAGLEQSSFTHTHTHTRLPGGLPRIDAIRRGAPALSFVSMHRPGPGGPAARPARKRTDRRSAGERSSCTTTVTEALRRNFNVTCNRTARYPLWTPGTGTEASYKRAHTHTRTSTHKHAHSTGTGAGAGAEASNRHARMHERMNAQTHKRGSLAPDAIFSWWYYLPPCPRALP